VREPDEKRALLADAGQQLRFAGELDEKFLEQVARVRLVAREIQEKGEQRLRVCVVEPCDVQAGGGICLAGNFSRNQSYTLAGNGVVQGAGKLCGFIFAANPRRKARCRQSVISTSGRQTA